MTSLARPVLAAEEPLPSDAQRLLEDHTLAAQEIHQAAAAKLLEQRKRTVAALRDLQDRYTKEGKLDEALAIRSHVRELVAGAEPLTADVLPAPDRLYQYREHGERPLYFQLTARPTGSAVWGTDIYTGDSPLAAAAIHAGAVELGETAIVKVTMLPGQESYTGSTRHGSTTSSYGSYSFSYRVERTPIPIRTRLTVPADTRERARSPRGTFSEPSLDLNHAGPLGPR